jgi:hypothetical protein
MATLERTNETILDAQTSIDNHIDDLKGWKASLHFSGVVGFTQPVDLFKYTIPEYREPSRKNQKIHPIRFILRCTPN